MAVKLWQELAWHGLKWLVGTLLLIGFVSYLAGWILNGLGQ
jgi:hypothetical protein